MSFKVFINESDNKRFSVRDANRSFFDHYLDELKREGADENEIKRNAARNFIGEIVRYFANKYNSESAHYEAKKHPRYENVFNVEGSTNKHEIDGFLEVNDNYKINFKKSLIHYSLIEGDTVKEFK